MGRMEAGLTRSRGERGETMMTLDDITGEIVDASIRVHQDLGPGLLESVYEAILSKVLMGRGLTVERQKPVCFEYDGISFDDGFRVDFDFSASPREPR